MLPLPFRVNPKQQPRRSATDATALRTVAINASSFGRRSTRLVLLWLLAVVLPLQGMAVVVFSALGPAHFHKQTQAAIVLTDFRRSTPSAVREANLFAFLGHSHGPATVQRHYHAFDDASVVALDADAAGNSSSVDEGLSAGTLLAAFWALRPDIVSWGPSQASNALASRPFWASMTVVVEPLERPPKTA